MKKLDEKFYSDYSDFLGTPLLALLLMLAFETNAEIPKALHTFYETAFFTLVRRHDAMKSQFLRKTYSDCSVADFSSIFSAFCFLTYCQWELQFTESDILNYLSIAAKKSGINQSSENLLKDFVESICVLQMDGLEYSFVHRSFQEYFSAVFLSKSPSDVWMRYLNEGKNKVYDNVIPMWFAMDKDRLEREWVVPKIRSLIDDFQGKDDLFVYKKITKTLDIVIMNGDIVSFYHDKSYIGKAIESLHQMYEDEFESCGFFISMRANIDISSQESKEIVRKYIMESDDLRDKFMKAIKISMNDAFKDRRSYFEIPSEKLNYELIDKNKCISYNKSLMESLITLKERLDRTVENEDDFLSKVFN